MNEEEVLQDMFVKGGHQLSEGNFFNVETYCEQKGFRRTQEVFLSFTLKSLSLTFFRIDDPLLKLQLSLSFFL